MNTGFHNVVRMKKVSKNLVIINSSEFFVNGKNKNFRSGIEVQIEELAKHFDNVFLYAPETKKSFEGYVLGKNINVNAISEEAPKNLFEMVLKLNEYTKKIKEIIGSHKSDLFCVYFPDSYVGVLATELLKFHDCKFFVRITSDLSKEFKNRHNKRSRKLLYYVVNPFIYLMFRMLLKNELCFYSGKMIYHKKPPSYKIISSSIKEKDIQKREIKEKGEYNIYYIGRFEGKKGVEYLIDAMDYIDKNTRLYLVGFQNEDKIKKAIKKSKSSDRIVFLGYTPYGVDIFRHYVNADIVVVPSLWDIQAKTHIEAMCFGANVIASNVGGIPNIVKDHYNGLLVKPANPKDIAEKVNLLINNIDLRKELAENGYITAKECSVESQTEFMIEKIIEKWRNPAKNPIPFYTYNA